MFALHSPRRYCALAAALAALLPAIGQAKDGEGDSHHAVAVSTAACTELVPAAGLPSARVGGAFTVSAGAAVTLICSLPTDELARSADDSPKPVTLQIAYMDSDGLGAALVTVELVRTAIAADPDGYADSVECGWSSVAGGPVVGTVERLLCPKGIVEGGFYHLRIGLTSAPGSAASFIGVVARR